MALLRTIGSGLVLALAALTFVVCAVGVFGVWVVKGDVDATGIAAIDLISGYLGQAGQSVASVDGTLAGVEQRLNTVRDEVARLREEGPDSAAGQILQRSLAGELLPSLDQMTVSAEQIRGGLGSFNESVNRLNRIPGVRLPTVSADLAAVEQTLVSAVTTLRELSTALQSLDGSRITAAAAALEERIAGVRATLGVVGPRIAAAEADLAEMRASLVGWTTIGTGVLSVLLAIFAAGQLSLAFHAWGWLRGGRGAASRPGQAGAKA